MAYARARHAAGVFPRPAEARLYGVRQWLAANRVVPDSVRLNLWLALGLLALCMVNVAGLLAARFVHRSGELGVRRVLGAPRRSIVMQCLAESGLAGVLGGLQAWPLSTGRTSGVEGKSVQGRVDLGGRRRSKKKKKRK